MACCSTCLRDKHLCQLYPPSGPQCLREQVICRRLLLLTYSVMKPGSSHVLHFHLTLLTNSSTGLEQYVCTYENSKLHYILFQGKNWIPFLGSTQPPYMSQLKWTSAGCWNKCRHTSSFFSVNQEARAIELEFRRWVLTSLILQRCCSPILPFRK